MKYFPILVTTSLIASPIAYAAMNVEQRYQQLEKNLPITLTFEEPLVGLDSVGKPAAAGMVSISPALDFETVWMSPTELELTLKENAAPRTPYQISVKTDKAIHTAIVRSTGEMDLSQAWYPDAFYPIFFKTYNEKSWKEAFDKAISSAHYLASKTVIDVTVPKGRKVVEKKFPTKIRQATVADVIAFKDIALDRYDSMNEEEWAEFIKLPPGQLVPNLWMAEPYNFGSDAENFTRAQLVLPGLGDYEKESESYGDLSVGVVTQPDLDYSIQNKQLASGLYSVTLTFSSPVIIKGELESLLPQIAWTQNFPDETDIKLTPSGKSSYKSNPPTVDTLGKVSKEGMELTLDVKETNKNRKVAFLPTGEKVDVLDQMVFTLKKGMTPSTLTATTRLETLGGPLQPSENKKHITTNLSPEDPHLFSDVFLSGLSLTGKREFSVNYELLNKPQVRVYQYNNGGSSAARVIAAYENYYAPYGSDRERAKKRASRSHAARALTYEITNSEKGVSSLVPTELLTPINERVIDLPSGNAEMTLSLSDKRLFPENGAGLYLIEFAGETLPDVHEGKAQNDEPMPIVVNQGLVQVTDLGMLWKSDYGMRKIFIYGYSLSTGKELASARIGFYNSRGQLLYEQAISPAGSTVDLASLLGDKASELAYLHLSTADDAYTIPFRPEEKDDYMRNFWDMSSVDVENYPEILNSTFTDRPLYRPGETVHVKGFLRQLQRNKLSIPATSYISALEATLKKDGEEIKDFDVKIEKDGSFNLSFQLPKDEEDIGDYILQFSTVNPSDATFASPDMKALGITSKTDYESKVIAYGENSWEFKNALDENRKFFTRIPVQHFRRNEFEIKEKMQVSPNAATVHVEVDAQQLTGAPVAKGDARWTLTATDTNFYPKGLRDYRFGDYRKEDMGYYNTYYWLQTNEATGESYNERKVTVLNDKGKGSITFLRPHGEFPRRQRLESSVSVTNGNEQTLSARSSTMVDPASLYIGMKLPASHSQLSEAGLKLDLLSVNTAGVATPTPSPITISVDYETSSPYSYGSLMRQMLQHTSESVTLPEQTVILDAQGAGHVQIPTAQPGIYTITAQGKDAQGREFRSAVKHYVWGKTEQGSVWERGDNNELAVIADKEIYQPGDTVRLLLQTPFDGEVLLSLQREGILRQIRQRVSKDKPVIEFPLQPSDAPGMEAEVILINGSKENKNGQVRILSGKVDIKIDPAEQRLKVDLNLPEKSILPGASCEISGQVLDAKGAPAAHATVALYAEDEGTLQAGGFAMPNPLQSFYSTRQRGVSSFSSLGQLLSENSKWRTFGNKGVFIGGGDDDDYFSNANGDGESSNMKLRENFTPCALWLGYAVSDAEGRFKTTVTNPDTLTRYRVIAVAASGEEQFGTGTGHYQVNKPIMLEPSAPLSACKGDLVKVPVTVTMIPEDLPAEVQANKMVNWKVQLKGSDTVQVIDPVQTVMLDSKAPRTITFAVNMKETGPVRFEWRVEAADPMGGKMGAFTDGVAEQLTIRPATPYLRESLFAVIAPGSTARANEWIKMDFDTAHTKVNLTLSPSPLAGYTKSVSMLHEYPYGCTEQLSSRCVPYIYAETFHRAAGTPLAPAAERKQALDKFVAEIMKRRLYGGALFSYWNDETSPSEFSAYTYLVLTRAGMAKQLTPAAQRSLEMCIPSIIRNLAVKENTPADPITRNPLWLYALASQGKLTVDTFQRIVKLRRNEWTTPQELWIVALVAQMISPDIASIYVMSAVSAGDQRSESQCHYLPSADITRQLLTALAMPQAEDTAKSIEELVRKHASNLYPNTFQSAWVGILLADYIDKAKLTEAKAEVNGKAITPNSPLSYAKTLLAQLPEFQTSAQGGKVYATGTALGYLKTEQANQLVDRGFHVQRRYEKLQPDGSWLPTAEFRVGDIIRVIITAKASQQSRYVALEDYLPAGVEAVNPEVPGQLLPASIMESPEENWYFPGWVTKREFLKDKVRFFVNNWSANGVMEASYIARVTKAGTMTAPAAKAEEMYRPEIYGLALPLKVTVQP